MRAAPSGVLAVGRVVQDRFPAITQLDANDCSYRLEFILPPVPAGTPNGNFRTPAGDALVFVDSRGGDNPQGVLGGAASQKRFGPGTGFMRLPAHGAARVATLTSAFSPVSVGPTPLAVPKFETRGSVRIGLPALRRGGPGFGSPFTQPQSNAHVKVLRIDSIGPADRGVVLAELPGDLNAGTADLKALDKAPRAAKLPLAVERRKPWPRRARVQPLPDRRRRAANAVRSVHRTRPRRTSAGPRRRSPQPRRPPGRRCPPRRCCRSRAPPARGGWRCR